MYLNNLQWNSYYLSFYQLVGYYRMKISRTFLNMSTKIWDHTNLIIEKIVLDRFYNRIKSPRIRKFRPLSRLARGNIKHLSNCQLCKRPWRPRAPCRLQSYNEWSSISAVARSDPVEMARRRVPSFSLPLSPSSPRGKRKGKQVSEEISPVIHRR